MNNKLGITQ